MHRRKKGRAGQKSTREEKEERLRQERQLQAKLAGGNAAEEAKTKDEKEAAAENPRRK